MYVARYTNGKMSYYSPLMQKYAMLFRDGSSRPTILGSNFEMRQHKDFIIISYIVVGYWIFMFNDKH